MALRLAGEAADGRPGEGHITILPLSYDGIGQGTWALYYGSSQYLYGQFYNSSHADGDNITYRVYLDAGTYTLLAVTRTQNTSGIIDIDIDGVEVASFDLYSASLAHDVRQTQSGIAVAGPGVKELRLRLDGKNPSASDYYAFIHYLALWRTS